MAHLPAVARRWAGPCIVAASGPSLTEEVARACKGYPIVAVNDAYRRLPGADVLYACDAAWWDAHRGCPDFAGERWSSHGSKTHNDKAAAAARYGLRLVQGRPERGFSLDPRCIHYGGNSGFQAINLAIHFGANPIVLVGFDMRAIEKRAHFFGAHPAPLKQPDNLFGTWVRNFAAARLLLPPQIVILNATPGSALKCFPQISLADGLERAA